MLKQIKRLFDKNEIKKLFFLVIFSVMVSLGEVFGLSMIVPFISVASNKNSLYENKYLKLIYEFFNFKSYSQFIIFSGIGIVIIFLLKNIMNSIFNYSLVNFARNNYYKVTCKLMNNYLKYPYKFFIKENSNSLNKNITTECNLLVLVLQYLLLLFSEVIVIIMVYIVMLVVNFKITLLVSIFLGVCVVIIKLLIINKTKSWGVQRAKAIEEYYKIIGATFGNYKFIKLLGNDEQINERFEIACDNYVVVDKKFQGTQPIPKYILEFLGFFIVVLLIVGAVIIYGEEGMTKIMPLITVFFIGLYRILPSLNRAVSYYQNIVFYRQSLNIIAKELEKIAEDLGNEKITFNEEIILKNLTFEYEKDKEILKDISLNIRKGERIAFVGESGSGKTTLVDSIIGLYKQKSGEIYIDNVLLTDENLRSWRSSIGYIPQEVYLFDGTVEDNIVFGREYDNHKLEEALKKAQIWEFLQKKNGVKTIVGDKGIMLSGGQKQRLAIARALYNNPEILVLDEATSALDNDTEKEIMNEIYKASENKTLIIIAHRLTTLEGCNRIVVLKEGRIEKIVTSIKDI
mgnify:FL=1